MLRQPLILLSLLSLTAALSPAFAFDRDAAAGMGGSYKGIGGMGGGFKGVGGMGGGFKGVGGMGGGFKGVGGMGGGYRGGGDGEARSRYNDYYYSRYGEYSTRYGENSTRYGENSTRYGENSTRYGGTPYEQEYPQTTTRYGITTGRYGEPVGGGGDDSLAARYQRAQMYRGIMQRLASVRNNEGPDENQVRMGAGSMYERMRALEAHPPTSFNHLYVE